MKSKGTLMAAFRSAALRCTPQRYAVLDYLAKAPVHATAEEVFRAVNRKDPRASRATVYNSLHALVRSGLVREVLLDGNAARFDANTGLHHHFVCDDCGGVEDIGWFDPGPLPHGAALGRRTLRSCEIIFRGLCGRCAPEKPELEEQDD